jgi:hypothetical protein
LLWAIDIAFLRYNQTRKIESTKIDEKGACPLFNLCIKYSNQLIYIFKKVGLMNQAPT